MNIFEPLLFTEEYLINNICHFFISLPFIIIEGFVILLLFTTILNVDFSRKCKVLYLVTLPLVLFLNTTILANPICYIVNILTYPLLLFPIFKINKIKVIVTTVLLSLYLIILEYFLLKIFLTVLNISNYDFYTKFNIYRLTFRIFLSFIFFSIFKLFKNCNVNIDIFKENSIKTKKIIFLLLFFNILSSLTLLYNYSFSKSQEYFSIFELLCFLFYFCITVFILVILGKLDTTSTSLESYVLYNKTLHIFQENLRTFKHDYSNTLQSIGGYIATNNMSGLKEYYLQLLDECQRINNLTVLSPNVVNNPAIYNIIASKYLKAENLNIRMDLEVFMDLTLFNPEIYNITRILGILLDNAIEACLECNEKFINIRFAIDSSRNRYLILIENTFALSNINIDKLYEKGFSTKKNNTGLGLFSVRKILSKSKTLNLHTSTCNNIFSQQLEMYYH